MKIVIDEDVCKVEGYSISEILYLISLYKGNQINDNTIEKLHKLGFVAVNSIQNNPEIFSYKDCYITRDGKKIIDTILYNSNKVSQPKDSKNKYDEFLDIAKEMQQLYPTGKKPGTNYQWRDSTVIIADRLMKLFKNVNTIPDKDIILKATKAYIESFNGNYAYMQLLKYFIFKKTIKDEQYETASQLLSYIENIDQENTATRDWTSTLK